MGQYYNPSILKKNWKQAKNPIKASLKCYDFGNGAKLMEHSYVHNHFMMAMCYLLSLKEYFGLPFVWSGDYADEVKTNTGAHDIYSDASHFMYKDYDSPTNDKDSCEYINLLNGIPSFDMLVWMGFGGGGYIVNLTKKQYVEVPQYNANEFTIHPLPLFTADGNSRGGGDYTLVRGGYDYSKDERIGSWKFDRIGFTFDITSYKNFKKVDGKFELDW